MTNHIPQPPQSNIERTFHIKVLGRMLEHLGVQMYKRRDIAVAELVANGWDAGATRVDIYIPDAQQYDSTTSEIIISDNGHGMNAEQIESQYLVVGRNRRSDDTAHISSRPVMGRKGIGKLAGFGVASEMTVTTWTPYQSTTFSLDIDVLKAEAGVVDEVPIQGSVGTAPENAQYPSGTKIKLQRLKHTTAIDIDRLHESLSRRFSRRVLGEMEIYINEVIVGEPNVDLDYRFPGSGFQEDTLPNGDVVRYFYGFAASNIRSRELQGFTIYVRGKTAQAPPFFFNVEATASGLHYARYMTGAIEADFLDEGFDDSSDLISTDRQEIDWADRRTREFLQWGDQLTRKALRERADNRGKQMEVTVMQDDELNSRINSMDKTSRTQVSRFLRQLGKAESDPDRAMELADSLVRAYEYRHFHNVVDQIEDVSEEPEQLSLLLTYLGEWKVLESRAILEIIRGRLEVIEKFHSMLVNNAPETASSQSSDNMHDLMAGYPWLLNPEWQVLAEEKQISTQLRQWSFDDIGEEDSRLRYDFLALGDDKRLIIIEIKRADHPVELDELQRLEKYKERLSAARAKDLYMVMVCGGRLNISDSYREVWGSRSDGEIKPWSEIYEKTRSYYEHYRAVLEGDISHSDFHQKQIEVSQTRNVLELGGTHRPPDARRQGLGPQDRNDPYPQ